MRFKSSNLAANEAEEVVEAMNAAVDALGEGAAPFGFNPTNGDRQ